MGMLGWNSALSSLKGAFLPWKVPIWMCPAAPCLLEVGISTALHPLGWNLLFCHGLSLQPRSMVLTQPGCIFGIWISAPNWEPLEAWLFPLGLLNDPANWCCFLPWEMNCFTSQKIRTRQVLLRSFQHLSQPGIVLKNFILLCLDAMIRILEWHGLEGALKLTHYPR